MRVYALASGFELPTHECDGALQRFTRPGGGRSDRKPERDFSHQALPFDAESQQLPSLAVCDDLDRSGDLVQAPLGTVEAGGREDDRQRAKLLKPLGQLFGEPGTDEIRQIR